jgi:hypothetical protein
MAATVVLDDSDGTNRTFTEVVSGNPNAREFRDLTNGTIDKPIGIRVTYVPTKQDGEGSNRFRITHFIVKQDSVSGKYATMSISLDIALPKNGGFTATNLKNLFENVSNFLHYSTNATAPFILLGNYPDGSYAS